MNILILHSSSDLYGASKILLVTVQAMRKKGHTPVVILTEPGPLSNELAGIGIEVVYARLGILRRKYQSISGMFNRLMVMRKAFYAVKKIIREKNIDLVYSNTTAVLIGAFAARSTGKKHIWHIHEIIEQPRWMIWILGKLVNRFSQQVIVVSEAVRTHWLRYVAAEKLHLIYNGIDYAPYLQSQDKLRAELGLDEKQVIIGMVGRVHHWKGQEYFLQIATQLAQSCSHIHFVMVGDVFPGYEYLYEKLAAIKKEAGIEQVVTDLGYRTDVPGLLAGFDIFVLPSTSPDPFPTVILEAMAAAKPVAATCHGGAMEMVEDGRTGVLIPVNDPQKAAALLAALITDAPKRKQMGDAGRQKVLATYSREAFEHELIKVLE